MEADWFADPLERFEGRFFNGVTWTEQISDNGVLGIDPDWPPAPAGIATASLLQESPVRIVAIVDRAALAAQGAAAPTAVERRPTRRYVLGLVATLVAIAVAALPFSRSTEGTDDTLEGGRTRAAVENGTAPDDEPAPSPVPTATEPPVAPAEELTPPEVDGVPRSDGGEPDDLRPDDALVVGGLRFVNGRVVLTDLAAWHESFAAKRGLELGAEASCWFASLGSAAVQNAFCGPVGGTAATAWLFDVVPLVFEDRGEGLIAQPIVGATRSEVALPSGLHLTGPVDPPRQLEGRGERKSGG